MEPVRLVLGTILDVGDVRMGLEYPPWERQAWYLRTCLCLFPWLKRTHEREPQYPSKTIYDLVW